MADRVDFYLLPGLDSQQRLLFACRLTEKVYGLNLPIAVLMQSANEAVAFDNLLWTFSDRAFVPHARGAGSDKAPVQIVERSEDARPAHLLINFAATIPPGLERFERVAEIVDEDAGRKALMRDRYREYRELNLRIETHQLGNASSG
jgi:DNA polymerase III subunit chi